MCLCAEHTFFFFFRFDIWLTKGISAVPGLYGSCHLLGNFNCKQHLGYPSFRLLCESGNDQARRGITWPAQGLSTLQEHQNHWGNFKPPSAQGSSPEILIQSVKGGAWLLVTLKLPFFW